jgi:hypothetical protein
MSVEDIDYLYENSEKDNFILYCDSALRNKTIFQHPSYYTIYFDQPFKYVYGVDVLDGSIPSVMYNIEDYENSVAGFSYTLNPNSTNDGYTMQSLLTELGTFDQFDAVFNSTTIVSQLAGGVKSYETGIVFITSFELMDGYLATLANSNNPTPSIKDYEQEGTSYFVYQRGVISAAVIFRKDSLLKFDFPVYEFSFKGITYQIINDPDNPVYQQLLDIVQNYLYYNITEVPKPFIIALRNFNNNIMYLMDMNFLYVTYSPGNYSVTSFLQEAKNGAFGSTNISVAALSAQDPSIHPKMYFSSPQAFVFDMNRSLARTSMGFDEFADIAETQVYKKIFYRNNDSLFGAVYDSVNQMWSVTAPGVIYLLGTRYCILRCPEIESHMHGSRAFGQFAPGIGMFKMYAVNDIAHQRFDFVNFTKKPFHPIGKLDRLTFKFERNDGTLYDFKGANHLMLLCIKFLVPSQKRKFTGSQIAPNYTPNIQSYLARNISTHENEEDEDDNRDISDLKKKYALAEKKYDYSYSGTEDDDDDD